MEHFCLLYRQNPCTTKKTQRVYEFESVVRIKGVDGKAQADQIMTVSKLRFKEKIGRVSKMEMEAIERAIQIQLGL